jgi:hypothetical protein
MSGHTKGPWIIFSDGGRPAAILPAGRDGEICQFANASKANARLIAAAPELLEAAQLDEQALEHFRKCERCEPGHCCPDFFELEDAAKVLRRAAIAKAKGRA